MIRKSKEWFDAQTQTIKKLTVWLSFFAALFAIWGTLKAFGVEGIDFVIGCSSYSTKTQQNTNDIDTLKNKSHWKWDRQFQFNDSIREQIRIINND